MRRLRDLFRPADRLRYLLWRARDRGRAFEVGLPGGRRLAIRPAPTTDLLTACELLLYDAYGYGSLETAMRAALDVKGYEWLHSIFWAASFSDRPNVMYPDSPGRAGCFLYSKSEGWRRVALVARPPVLE